MNSALSGDASPSVQSRPTLLLATIQSVLRKGDAVGHDGVARCVRRLLFAQERFDLLPQIIVSCPQAYLLRAQAYCLLGKTDLALADEKKANKLSHTSESSSLPTTCPEN